MTFCGILQSQFHTVTEGDIATRKNGYKMERVLVDLIY